MKIGPRTQRQLRHLANGDRFGEYKGWAQGEHVVISGATGSGKTTLGRLIDQIRIERGGHVVLFVAKLSPDSTIVNDYKGWTRWTEWKKNPSPKDRRILLWPDVSKAKTLKEMREIQRRVFLDAINHLAKVGKWTVDFDEGLYMCSPSFMNLADEIAMLHALGRSSELTVITKMQRPANVPLIVYGSASHAFVGRVRERTDLQRLSELGSNADSKALAGRLSSLGRRDFMWIPVAPDWPPEIVNVAR